MAKYITSATMVCCSYEKEVNGWVTKNAYSRTSDVTARLGLEAVALAWLSRAQA
ncbi:hypothetical protein K443DRAFT_678995 [Laccaria amethystina LaAM-08-1]|uniref:Uncharacterized protein n=1 Tax=Laccaria amethystina LaAM-08-1 TaxID=1095629 RepID=A0A0C9XXV9_9AGAR|nr:hypothetical protein K443DRAFT_678995 [Laccaria amethystina LaAM-08-1]